MEFAKVELLDILNLPNTDLLSEILRSLDTISALHFLSACSSLYNNIPIIDKRLKRAKLSLFVQNNLIQKSQFYSGIIGRMREWMLYLPHKYELSVTKSNSSKTEMHDVYLPKGDASLTMYHLKFDSSGYLSSIPYKADIIEKITFDKKYDEIRLRYNHALIFVKKNSDNIILNLPTDKLLKQKLIYVEAIEYNKYITDLYFTVSYILLDDYRRYQISKPGCIEVTIDDSPFLITTDGLLIQLQH